VNRNAAQGILQPLVARPHVDFPIIHYEDNTLLLMQANANQASLSQSSSQFFCNMPIHVNYNKSRVIPINI
jgi:hypothetical protein